MTYGTWQLAGFQSSTPQGGEQSLGPFAVPFGPVTSSQPVVVNTTATVAVPADTLGVAIIPPIGNSSPSLKVKTLSSDSGIFLAPGQPTLISFDPDNMPSDIYLVSGSSVTVQIQFT